MFTPKEQKVQQHKSYFSLQNDHLKKNNFKTKSD